MEELENIKIVSGIDTLYFFIETNEDYDSLFLDVLDQYGDCIDRFTILEADYKNEDITVQIGKCTFTHVGMAQGFYWFKDINNFFKFGIKDKRKNRGLHNIQVQLTADGIYSVGIKSILELIDSIFVEFSTGQKLITRADLNAFTTYDFSSISKDMFVTRKKQFTEFKAIGSKNSLSTIYVGKKPFLLRMYDKKQELIANGKKEELMGEYLANHGIDISSGEPLWNIEFELHREHLKSFNIFSVDELLTNAKAIFEKCMEDVRLIDIDTLTQKMIDSGHSNRAETLLIWDKIKDAYDISEFMQSTITLERLKRKEHKYTEQKALEEHIALGRKAKLNGIVIGKPFYEEVERKINEKTSVKHKLKDELERLKELFEDIEVHNIETGEIYTERLDKTTNRLYKLSKTVSFSKLTDYELYKEHERLVGQLLKHSIDSMEEKTAVYKVRLSRKELIKRGLIDDEPMPF